MDNICFMKQTTGSTQTTVLRKKDGGCVIWTGLWKLGLRQVDFKRKHTE